MERFKSKIDLGAAAHAAARTRMSDQDFQTFSKEEEDKRAARYLANPLGGAPNLKPAGILQGLEFNRWFKDTKFMVHLLNLQLGMLEDTNSVEGQGLKETLEESQLELYRLRAEAEELERYTINRYTAFHHNTFARVEDQDTGDIRWKRDWKAGRPLPKHSVTVIPGVGMIDGIKSQNDVPISMIEVVQDETDAGTVLVSSSPVNLLVPGKTFKYITVLEEHTAANVPLVSRAATLTLSLEFTSMAMVNRLEFIPVSGVSFELDIIHYKDETGTEHVLEAQQFSVDGKAVMLFAPLKAKAIKLSFLQTGAVTRGQVVAGDSVAGELNRVVEGLGWIQRFSEVSSTIDGVVHDFSMESIKASLVEYQTTTVMTGRKLLADNPVGMRWSTVTTELDTPTTNQNLGGEYEGAALQETYLGIDKLDTKDNVLGSCLVPVPDSAPQVEYLIGNGLDTKVKLFPNLRATLDRQRVLICSGDGTTATLTTENAHGFVPGDSIGFYGRPVLDDSFVVDTVPSPTTFTVASSETLSILADDTPYLWCFDQVFTAPITVYENGIALSLGGDYEVSIDSGLTWLSGWPVTSGYDAMYSAAIAGQFRVKILNQKYHLPYWVEYSVLSTQWLEPNGSVYLKNGRILLTKYNRIAVTPILINRVNLANPYSATILKSYSLGILSAE